MRFFRHISAWGFIVCWCLGYGLAAFLAHFGQGLRDVGGWLVTSSLRILSFFEERFNRIQNK